MSEHRTFRAGGRIYHVREALDLPEGAQERIRVLVFESSAWEWVGWVAIRESVRLDDLSDEELEALLRQVR